MMEEKIYKCDGCKKQMGFNEYYNKTDNLKFKPNIILTLCETCSEKVRMFIRENIIIRAPERKGEGE